MLRCAALAALIVLSPSSRARAQEAQNEAQSEAQDEAQPENEARVEPRPDPQPALPEVVAIDSPAVDEQGPQPNEPVPPVYETWWFWTAIGAIVLGITTAIVVDLTTDDPATSMEAMASDGLRLRF
jgi:hypothetical protein